MNGKSVLISGGSRGIGAEVVRCFAEDGWKVAFIYNKSEKQAKALERETGAVAIQCDLGSAEAAGIEQRGLYEAQRDRIAQGVADAKTLLGVTAFDALVCNAGIAKIGLLTEMTPQEWQDMLSTNLSASFFLIQEVLPGMISAKSGSIVTVSSMWGQVGASCEVAYSATKAGLIGMSKGLAKEVGPSGIRVNCVAPGVIDTDMNGELDGSARGQLCQEIPLGRIGSPGEVARVIRFLAGEESSYITGQVIGVNGGMVI